MAEERLEVDSEGYIFPCFRSEPSIRKILTSHLPSTHSRQQHENAVKALQRVPTLGEATPAVVRGMAWANAEDPSHRERRERRENRGREERARAIRGEPPVEEVEEEEEDEKPDSFFTAFFVSPRILVTARHNLYDKSYRRMKRFAFSLYVSLEAALCMYSEGIEVVYEPVEEPLTAGTRLVHDFVFLQPIYPNYLHNTFLKPSSTTPTVGNIIATIQFNGEVDEEWMDKQCKYANLAAMVELPSVLRDLITTRQSVSVGHVAEIRTPTIFYANSTTDGASGGPGFIIDPVTQIEFCSIHGGGFNNEAHNHGTLSTDPVFMDAFSKIVKM